MAAFLAGDAGEDGLGGGLGADAGRGGGDVGVEVLELAAVEDGFLGEETGPAGVGANLWVVDPIDGTANFARRIPHFCISIAFVAGNRTQLGAIYNPVLDELYLARRGRGAEKDGKRIRVADTGDPQAACVELGWSNRVPRGRYLGALERMLEIGVNIRRNASGALGLAYVADGRSDGEIGAELFITRRTASKHVAAILDKLGVSNRTAAVALAVRHGII